MYTRKTWVRFQSGLDSKRNIAYQINLIHNPRRTGVEFVYIIYKVREQKWSAWLNAETAETAGNFPGKIGY